MGILSTEAVVLKGWKMGETSKILSLFTRDFGKVRVVVKGGRNPKSPFKGCLESLTHIRAIYYNKPIRELQLLSKADLIDPHFRIIGDPKRTALALAQVELVEKAISGEQSHPGVFDLLIHTLQALNQEDGFLEGVLWYFEGRFIDLMGYKPTWDSCISCKKSLGVKGGFFQPSSGGLYCSDCGRDHGGLVVNPETLEILFFLQRESLKESCRLVPTQLQKAEIRKMFDLYFKAHIEHLTSLKSLALFYIFDKKGGIK
jgi:DNA repair protein RecO (recombination protein O)